MDEAFIQMNESSANQSMNGLVLSGGGARSAYQVGVLRAISEITQFKKNPFKIITGLSAGAINGTWLASRTENFDQVTNSMWDAWASITMEQVFKTSSLSMGLIALRWLKDRAIGSMQTHNHISYLLDTSPLFDFLRKNIDFEALNRNLKSDDIYGFSVISANYHTGQSTAFFSGDQKIKSWEALNRLSIRTEIQVEHVMASSAIPIFFPPIRVGEYFYGDGMVRLTSPLSPAIHMGAEKLLVIGIRGPSSQSDNPDDPSDKISVGEVAGTILNGMFFDCLDSDIACMQKMNRILLTMSPEDRKAEADAGELRHIPLLSLNPSEEVAVSNQCELSRLPLALIYMLRGLGVTEDKGRDLLSYLAFEPKYMKQLLELGYEDTLKKRAEVIEFFGPFPK
jgi:NTE family protein